MLQTAETKVFPNPKPVKPRPDWMATVPGDMALLCLDCGTVYHVKAGACSCGSKAGLHVLKALDRRGATVEVKQ